VHELNDVKTMQLVPTEVNSDIGHLGGIGEINAIFINLMTNVENFYSKITEKR
jgi:NAD+--asparagine ADP-ribosyltransferase